MAVTSIEELKPVYLIFSKEELLLERAIRRLRQRVAEGADLVFNFAAFDGESTDADEIVAVANTLPFDSDKRLIVVRGVDRMTPAGQRVLADYAASPSPSTCLVLAAATVNRGSRLYKAVDRLGGVAEYKAPKRSEYPQWVAEYVATHGRRMDRGAAEALVRAVGRDLRRLTIEADKVMAYAGAAASISAADVEAVVAGTAPASVFELLDAIGGRDCAAAVARLHDLLSAGEALLGIHAMVLRHLRTLASVRALMERGETATAIAKETGLPDWLARSAMEQARRFEPAELVQALREAAGVEAALKSGSGDERVTYESWLIGVCRRS